MVRTMVSNSATCDQNLPTKQKSARRHDCSNEDAQGHKGHADRDEGHSDDDLLPWFCKCEIPSNDHQESAVHDTSTRSKVETSLGNFLMRLETLSQRSWLPWVVTGLSSLMEQRSNTGLCC
jgi:hypothetical protein